MCHLIRVALLLAMTRSSRKQALHEPARGRRFTLVKPFAVEPEAVAVAILDEVIIAGLPRFAMTPPRGADAFGALRRFDLVGHPAPAKTARRTFGNERHDVF